MVSVRFFQVKRLKFKWSNMAMIVWILSSHEISVSSLSKRLEFTLVSSKKQSNQKINKLEDGNNERSHLLQSY